MRKKRKSLSISLKRKTSFYFSKENNVFLISLNREESKKEII